MRSYNSPCNEIVSRIELPVNALRNVNLPETSSAWSSAPFHEFDCICLGSKRSSSIGAFAPMAL